LIKESQTAGYAASIGNEKRNSFPVLPVPFKNLGKYDNVLKNDKQDVQNYVNNGAVKGKCSGNGQAYKKERKPQHAGMTAKGVHAGGADPAFLTRFFIRVVHRYGKKQGVDREHKKNKSQEAKYYLDRRACLSFMGKGLKADGYGEKQGAKGKQKPQGFFPEKNIVEVAEKKQYEGKDP